MGHEADIVDDTLTPEKQQAALALVSKWLGVRFGLDGPAPSSVEAYRRGKGAILIPDWNDSGKPTPAIVLEAPWDWAFEISEDEAAMDEMHALGIIAEHASGDALCLYRAYVPRRPQWAKTAPATRLWDVIEAHRPEPYDADTHVEAVEAALQAAPVEAVLAFGAWFEWALRSLYLVRIFEAAANEFGVGSDDRFLAFRSGVVMQGKEVFSQVFEEKFEHERLNALEESGLWSFEEVAGMARRVYRDGGHALSWREALTQAGLVDPAGIPSA